MDRPIKLEMAQGDAPAWPFVIEHGGGAQPLDGMTIIFGARYRSDDLAYVFSKTLAGGGITVEDEDAGLIRVQLESGDTASVTPPATLLWALEVTDVAGHPVEVATGTLHVRRAIVRP